MHRKRNISDLNSEDEILQDTQDVISGKLTESLDLQDSDTIDNQIVTTNDIIPNTISTTEEQNSDFVYRVIFCLQNSDVEYLVIFCLQC
jgi:hypothetical protein